MVTAVTVEGQPLAAKNWSRGAVIFVAVSPSAPVDQGIPAIRRSAVPRHFSRAPGDLGRIRSGFRPRSDRDRRRARSRSDLVARSGPRCRASAWKPAIRARPTPPTFCARCATSIRRRVQRSVVGLGPVVGSRMLGPGVVRSPARSRTARTRPARATARATRARRFRRRRCTRSRAARATARSRRRRRRHSTRARLGDGRTRVRRRFGRVGMPARPGVVDLRPDRVRQGAMPTRRRRARIGSGAPPIVHGAVIFDGGDRLRHRNRHGVSGDRRRRHRRGRRTGNRRNRRLGRLRRLPHRRGRRGPQAREQRLANGVRRARRSDQCRRGERGHDHLGRPGVPARRTTILGSDHVPRRNTTHLDQRLSVTMPAIQPVATHATQCAPADHTITIMRSGRHRATLVLDTDARTDEPTQWRDEQCSGGVLRPTYDFPSDGRSCTLGPVASAAATTASADPFRDRRDAPRR